MSKRNLFIQLYYFHVRAVEALIIVIGYFMFVFILRLIYFSKLIIAHSVLQFGNPLIIVINFSPLCVNYYFAAMLVVL